MKRNTGGWELLKLVERTEILVTKVFLPGSRVQCNKGEVFIRLRQVNQ